MKTRPLAAHLIDFSAPRRPASAAVLPPVRDEAAIAAARADGFGEGFAAGRAQAQEDGDRRVGEIETRIESRLADARAEWTQATAQALADRLDTGVAEWHEVIAASVARILAEVATLARRPVLVDEAVARLLPLLAKGAVARFEVAGPADLVDALCRRLEGHAVARRDVADGVDLRIRIDETLFETRLAEWRLSLLAALEATP